MKVRFSREALNGATPGLSRLAQSLVSGDRTEQAAYDQAGTAQSRIAQALAAARASDANAAQSAAQAAEHQAKADVLTRRPGVYEEQAALSSGQDVPNVQAFRQLLATGRAGAVPMGPDAPDGSMGVGTAQFSPEARSKITQALTRLAPVLLNGGDFKVDDWAKAAGAYQDQDQEAAVANGTMAPMALALQRAAAKGSPAFHFDTSGQVGNNFTGALDGTSPRAVAVTGKEVGLGKQAVAGAAENYAQARSADALAGKHRAETDDVRSGGGAGKAPVGYRWGAGGALEPIPGGPADPATKGAKLAKPPTEGQAKALMFGSRMAVADEVLGELDKKGARLPSLTKAAAESLPGIGTAAGMVANRFASPEQQQVEQAQRDFINAVLRRESGAAIADSEFANAKRQYFPAPNDSPQVRAQKAANRQTAIAGFKAEFGEQSMPQFEEIVGTARKSRAASSSGATGSWEPAAKPGKNIVVEW